MPTHFIHVGDLHLGNQQYGLTARFNDFGRAFLEVVDYAVAQQVDFFLIAGDLFHKQAIDPLTLLQAVEGLGRLRAATIPVVAIEGNHDRSRYRDAFSWLEFLNDQHYLHLLSTPPGTLDLVAWDDHERQGSFIDLGNVRIYGVQYLGAALPNVLPPLIERLPDRDSHAADYTIFMLHAGLEGEVPNASDTLTHNQVAPLKEHIDYLALGHIHKQYERDGWIYNPGALEACSIEESAWPRGFYHVQIDDSQPPEHTAHLIEPPRRVFHRLTFGVDHCSSPTDLYEQLTTYLTRQQQTLPASEKPVVELRLQGVLPFDRADLDLDHLRSMVETALQPLVVRLKNDTRPTEFAVAVAQDVSREVLERSVLRELIERDGRYRQHAEAWATLMMDVKERALARSNPADIVDLLKALP